MPAGRLHLVLITALALSACNGTKDRLVAQGFSPTYAEGYDEGCSSGKAAGGGLFDSPSKDEDRYAGESDYAQGWDAGFIKCRSTMQTMTRNARTLSRRRDR